MTVKCPSIVNILAYVLEAYTLYLKIEMTHLNNSNATHTMSFAYIFNSLPTCIVVLSADIFAKKFKPRSKLSKCHSDWISERCLEQEGPWALGRSPENDRSVEWNHL